MEIEYVTEEPEIYDPNFVFFKRIFEAFKVFMGVGSTQWVLGGGSTSGGGGGPKRHPATLLGDRFRFLGKFLKPLRWYLGWVGGTQWVLGVGGGWQHPRVPLSTPLCPPQLTDDVKKDKEKEPDKADRAESATVPKKKGFEDGHKGSEDDSSEDEQVGGGGQTCCGDAGGVASPGWGTGLRGGSG